MDEDFFNNLFSDDFFKNHLSKINPEDFMDEYGNIDHDKLREESMKMFEEFTGKKPNDFFNMDALPSDKLFPSLDGDKIGMGFVQDLDSEEGKEMFDSLVNQHNLSKESEIVDINGEEHIQEIWTNDAGTVRVKRIYKLNDDTTSKMLSDEEQIELHQAKLDEAVDVENYEEASILRDKINELKNA